MVTDVKPVNPTKDYDPQMSASLLRTIAANVDNAALSDGAFRAFIRNSLPVAERPLEPISPTCYR